MNAILEQFYTERKGMYCHALEVNDLYELQCVLDQLYSEFIVNYSVDEIIEFFESMELYCLVESEESEVYDFNIAEYIKNL